MIDVPMAGFRGASAFLRPSECRGWKMQGILQWCNLCIIQGEKEFIA
jgi:hypothetical protein